MTVTYSLDVSTSSFSAFTKLLFRWRGSIWKSVYKELLIWLVFYFILSGIYRLLLDEKQRAIFEDIVAFCAKYIDLIPLTFMLGFFITLVVNRWWDMFKNLGWIQNTSLYVASYIQGKSERPRIIRRNIIRYVVLAQALVFRDISVVYRLQIEFTARWFVSAKETKAMDSVVSPHRKYWIPVHWAMTAVFRARQEGFINSDHAVQDLLDKVRQFRTSLAWLSCYDWVPIPLVYTQVVVLMTRCYFLLALMGRQYTASESRELNNASPFVVCIGWLKVAEALLNPMSDDDDDFELNWLLDRNLQMGLSVVDDAVGKEPPMEKDVFWEDSQPELLYSAVSVHAPENPLVGSATEIDQGREDNEVVMMVSRASENNAQLDGINVGTPLPTRQPVFVHSVSRTSSTRSNGLFTRLNISLVLATMRKFLHGSRRLAKETLRRISVENGKGIANSLSFLPSTHISADYAASFSANEANNQVSKDDDGAKKKNGNKKDISDNMKQAEISGQASQDEEKPAENWYQSVSNKYDNDGLSDVMEEDEISQKSEKY